MSVKVVAEDRIENCNNEEAAMVVVREYDEGGDKAAVEELEWRCEVGGGGKTSLVTDLMGDPICRIRHFPFHVMLVAEYGEGREVVGVIRACIKMVTIENSVHVKLANMLGLRVTPTHRRLGIGAKLVQEAEEWCKKNGAEYAYMATDCSNQPSINLFTRKCSYTKFRTPTMLVQPVYAHYRPLRSGVAIIRLTPRLADTIYRRVLGGADFFPEDMDVILSNKLNLGTFIAMPKKFLSRWDPKLGVLPPSYAILSVWNTKNVFKLQVKGVSRVKYACCVGSRLLDSWMPWLRLPSFPNVFRKFGVYFLYGLHMEGKYGPGLMKDLCAFAHNMGRDDDGCGALVTEVGPRDPVREVVPHWKKFSWDEDLWCIKKLNDEKRDGDGDDDRRYEPSDWMKHQSSSCIIFVDPRDI